MKSKNFIKRWINILVVILGVTCITANLAVFFRPLYIHALDKNVSLCVSATSEQNEHAVGNNVRVNHISVNGKDINLANVLEGNTSAWKYDSENDFLYAYDLDKAETFEIGLENVHTLKISIIQEIGSGYVELRVDDIVFATKDLYKDTQWEEQTIEYDSSVFVRPEKHLEVIVLCILGIVMGVLLWNQRRPFSGHFINEMKRVSLIEALSIVTFIGVCVIQFGFEITALTFVSVESQVSLKTILFIYLLIELLTDLFGKLWLGYISSSVLLWLGIVVSNIKLDNRGIPLLPWDFSKVGEALSIIDGYSITVPMRAIIILGLLGLLAVILWKYPIQKINTIRRRAVGMIVLCLLVVFIQRSFIHCDAEINNADYRVYQVDKYYSQRGYIAAFLEYCAYLSSDNAPSNYTKETMVKITQDINNLPDADAEKKPTVIAVMSESFWDISRVDTLDFYQDVLPNFNSLKQESHYGELYTHVLNGGTVVSEFEFLTGFSGEFFPEDYMVYGGFLDEAFPSAVGMLKDQGYKTIAMHPYIASNYNREVAYQKLGFDESYFDHDFEGAELIRDYVSDRSLFSKIITTYEGNETESPQFIFAVTMQNHGGYWENTIYKAGMVPYYTESYGEVAQKSINDYVAGLHESDRALGELVDYFRKVDEPVIIVYFGDHVSNAGPKDDRMLEKTSWHDDSMEYEYETHKVPFVVWSNFDQKSENLGIMEIGELFPSIFNLYDIKANRFWNYIQDVRDVYGASSKRLVVDKEGTYSDLSTMTEEQKTDYDIYRLLQYDYIWGKRYAEELWDLN